MSLSKSWQTLTPNYINPISGKIWLKLLHEKQTYEITY